MGEKNDGLGLNLSLGLVGSEKNCVQNPVCSSFDQYSKTARVYQREINMNEPPTTENFCDDDEADVPLPISDCEEDGGGDGGRKKLRLSKEQCVVLEETFKEHATLNLKQKVTLAKQLSLKPRQIEVWFQNRRARTKLKQTEVNCEYLRICCEKLTEDNKRLQEELLYLRALKLSPRFSMLMNPPPTTLVICPSCEKVVVNSSSPSSVATDVDLSAGFLNTYQCNSPHIHRPVPINIWASKHKVNPLN